MALLARVATVAALSGCYSPDLRDCTVTCASSADCAGAQVCGSDHFCARPASAGTCARTQSDGGGPPGDAGPDASAPPDAGGNPPRDAAPDAAPTGVLQLQVMGHGELVAGSHMCSTDCMFELPLVPVDVVAVAAGDQAFDGWTIGPCVGSPSTTCTVTPPATVGVRFHKGDH